MFHAVSPLVIRAQRHPRLLESQQGTIDSLPAIGMDHQRPMVLNRLTHQRIKCRRVIKIE